MNRLRAGAAYFAWVFGAGFLLGCIRVPFLVPRLGARTAELIELPFMLAVCWYASRHVARRFGLTAKAGLAAGLIGLGLIVAAEFALSAALTGRNPAWSPVFLASLAVYAALPWWHSRSRA